MRALLVVLGLVAVAGTAAACEGLSPGDQIIMDGSSCSLAFILASPTDLYFATAGHCIQVDQVVTNPDYGEIGRGAFHFLEPETGSASDGSPGMDFGLIRIDPSQYPNLNPKVCGWDGPVGIYEGGAEGGSVRHYGHGVVLGENPVTRPREGHFLSTDEQAFYWTGAAVLGDSGSAVLDENNLALGVFTHVLIGVNGVPPADNGGTRLQRGLELAAMEGFTDLRLVLMGEDPVAVMMQMRGEQPAAPADPTPEGPSAPSTKPGTSPSRPAPASPTPGANSTAPASGENDSVDPASTDETEGATTTTKDTPFLAAPSLALALALALVLTRRRER